MRLGGVPIGPRKLAAAALGAAGLVVFAVIVWLGGPQVGLVLIAGLLGVILLAIAVVYRDLGRHHSVTQPPARHARSKLTVTRSPAVPVALDGDAIAVTREIRADLDALREAVEARLDEADRSRRHTRAAAAWLRAGWEHHRTAGDTIRAGDATHAGDTIRADHASEVGLIRSSGFFDADWYQSRSGVDVADAVAHYVDHAAVSGVDPHPLFASTWYLERHPDALVRWRTPLAHFLAEGDRRRLDPHPTFWSQWYAERYLPPGETRPPVVHFLRDGADAGCDPNPLFHVRWYQDRYHDRLPPGANPLVHYLTAGAAANLDPSPLFHTEDARRRVGVLDGDPLSTFLDAERDPAVGVRRPRVGRDATGRPAAADLRWEYLSRGLHHEPDTFVLYRIIGNDLPPRHRAGQGLENLRFILDHEPDLPGCQKRWVVNRIVDPQLEQQVIALLTERGKEFLHLPFVPDEYRRVGWRFAELSPPGFTYRGELRRLKPNDQQRVLDHVYHDKNLYVMNNNGARNAALRQGRGAAKWVLPWDGNCFLTREAWDALVAAVTAQPYLKYFSVPMVRILDNEQLLRPGLSVDATEEPQLVFRRDAREEFNPDARYGRRPKVELFYRLAIPGPWDTWTQLPWDLPRAPLSPEAGQFGEASWVARLFSGQEQLEGDIVDRGWSRIEAIRDQIDRIDERLAAESFDAAALFTLDDERLAGQRQRHLDGEPGPAAVVADLVRRAEKTLDGPLYSVTTKTTLPPSGDRHDYWHPAPYWWPNPKTRNGLPYVWRDGQRVPGTLLWEPGSEQYDRSALQSMIDETMLVALAGYFTGEARFFTRGADLLRAWFLDPRTRMTPHLRYAQVRRGHNDDQGTPSGIIETNDFHYLLDAARLLAREGALTSAEAGELRSWFGDYRAWLRDSDQGRGELSSLNNHGTWYDVQVAAIDAYLNDLRGLLDTLRRSHERVGQQFQPDGRQPEELARTQTQHYCAYNLQGWVSLAGFSRRVGQDLWSYRTRDGRGLAAAARWVLAHVGQPWPYEQLDEFDADRFVVLAHALAGSGEPVDLAAILDAPRRDAWAVKQVFTPHDGIRPFWIIGGGW